jgi:hypothetical protein
LEVSDVVVKRLPPQPCQRIGIPVRQLSLLNCLNDCDSEATAQPNVLIEIEITATFGIVGFPSSGCDVIFVELKKRLPIDQSQIERATSGDNRADFEMPRKLVERSILASDTIPLGPQFDGCDKEFSSDGIARALGLVVRRLKILQIESGALAEPKVREFMRKSKHLRRFRIGAVHEYEWCASIDQNEASKLVRIELAMCV